MELLKHWQVRSVNEASLPEFGYQELIELDPVKGSHIPRCLHEHLCWKRCTEQRNAFFRHLAFTRVRSFNAAVASKRQGQRVHPLPFTCPMSNLIYQRELLKCLNQIATSWHKHSSHAAFLYFPSWPQHQPSGKWSKAHPTAPSCPAATAALPPHCSDSPGSVDSPTPPMSSFVWLWMEAPKLHVCASLCHYNQDHTLGDTSELTVHLSCLVTWLFFCPCSLGLIPPTSKIFFRSFSARSPSPRDNKAFPRRKRACLKAPLFVSKRPKVGA